MDTGSTFGLGDLTYELFFSPAAASSVTWGVGPALILPTAPDDALGSGKWSAGPAAVFVAMPGMTAPQSPIILTAGNEYPSSRVVH